MAAVWLLAGPALAGGQDGPYAEPPVGATTVAAQDRPVAEAAPTVGRWPPADALVPALGLTLLASLLDEPARDEAARHADAPGPRLVRATGDALPFAAFGVAAWRVWADRRDAGTVDRAAVEAGLWAVGIAQGVKLVTARARPSTGLGPGQFDQDVRVDSAFPSLHAALTWAVLTPYAQAYDAPWLYGLALASNASRVIGRRHWLSDTVAGALLGYWQGTVAWQRRSESPARASWRWGATPGGVWVTWRY